MTDQNTPSTKRERSEAARAERLEREQAAASQEARRRRLMQLGGLLAVAVVVVIVAVVVSSGGGDKNAAKGGSLQGVAETQKLLGGIPQKGITLGNPDAPAQLVEFADPQCPFCKDYTLDEMPQIVRKYVRTGKLKMDLRFLTFIGPDSLTAAGVLEASGQQNKMWTVSDLLYRNQGEENSGYITDAFLTKILNGAGADAKKAIAGAGSPYAQQQIGAAKTLASRYGVSGTPTILVGPSGGDLKTDTESTPTAGGIGKMVDEVLAKAGT